MKYSRSYIGGNSRFVLALWLVCLHLSGGFCAEPIAKTDPIIPLAEILKRWQSVSLNETVSAAEKGDLTAQHFLGYYHVEGLGGKVDHEEGMRWYLRAAAAGFPNSLNNLGVIYLNGNGVTKDEAKAFDYFKKAGERGLWRAMRFASQILMHQQNGKGQMEEFRRKMEKAARAGDAEAQLQLGLLLLAPVSSAQIEVENAAYMLTKAAEQGRGEAYAVMGHFFMESHIDYTKARKWFQLGADKGQPDSETALSWMYFNSLGVPADKGKAYELATRAAERKYLPAMVNMGRYYTGDDIENLPEDFNPDYGKAAEWYERAAKLGSREGAHYLEQLNIQGKGRRLSQSAGRLFSARTTGPGESSDGVAALEKLALKMDNAAISRLAKKYQNGKGVPRDFYHAIRLYRFAKDRGDNAARQALAVIDANDQPIGGMEGEETVFAIIYASVNQAYKRKDGAFFFSVANNYVEGDGVPQDYAEASYWYLVAEKYGQANAQLKAAESASYLNERQKELLQFWISNSSMP